MFARYKRKRWWNRSRRKIFNKRIIYPDEEHCGFIVSQRREFTRDFRVFVEVTRRSTRQRTWIRQSPWSTHKSLGELQMKYEGRKVNDCGSIDRVAESSQTRTAVFIFVDDSARYIILIALCRTFIERVAEYAFSLSFSLISLFPARKG